MTNPGDIERVATKIVPYYVVGVVDDEETDAPADGESEETVEPEETPVARRPRPRWVGFIAAALGVATLVLLIIAMIVSAGGDYPTGTLLAQVTIVVSISAAVTAALCLVFGLQRRWAAFGLAVAILANPLVVLNVFRFFES
ncbi:1,4-dihydroxy-6-naphthoate synthase [Salinibacterium sp. UTAS2018]|uniref:1,4-dihydroxy-6-naphthoate synthase n=1 Tax=Salinibacterium sp. UTAS2018 TaxID=2508880 RepID=UPI001009458B|nr:1,4-dihydroxy-6-naphthoate synthase [Salinibacterium sp. UTAS2018]QAV71028.1 1,4-dihydroxy-6-naphthoate synthase [Salinibacterium sp. UTAS2018]